MINQNIVYLNNDGVFTYTNNSSLIKIEDMLQRLQTWKNEQSFNANNGVDYLGVFNKQSLLKPQLDSIISEYLSYFQTITYDVVQTSAEHVSIPMRITLLNGNVAMNTFVV